MEVVIGLQNNVSQIRDSQDGVLMQSAQTPDILSCDELRSFWISFASNHYFVGTGDRIGENVFMDWPDSRQFDIAQFQFSTSSASEGLWELKHFQSMT